MIPSGLELGQREAVWDSSDSATAVSRHSPRRISTIPKSQYSRFLWTEMETYGWGLRTTVFTAFTAIMLIILVWPTDCRATQRKSCIKIRRELSGPPLRTASTVSGSRGSRPTLKRKDWEQAEQSL